MADLAFNPPDDGDPNVVPYPGALDPVIAQEIYEVSIHNLTVGDIVYSLEPSNPAPAITGGNTMATIPAGQGIHEEILQRETDNAITRLRIVAAVAGNVEVVLHV
jgi:hypothetical protein